MSLSTLSSSAVSPVVNAMALYKQANGEYLAGDVASDYSAATKLGLVRLPDGNYGSLLSAILAPASAAANSSSGVQSALSNLVLGG
jgi:hypothetical protein